MFNRRRGLRDALFLGESGDKALDSLFVEHNGVLLARDAPPDLVVSCLRAARTAPIGATRPWRPRRLVLSGVGEATLAAARLVARSRLRRSVTAPFVDLARLRRGGSDYLEGLSANARYQIRRSDRAYAALGALEARRAETEAEAHAWLDELAALHQATWTGRGEAGAFGNAFFRRFQHALIDRGLERQEVDVLHVTISGKSIGFLHNFRFRGRSLAYQSGFDYAVTDRHMKPGLTSHHAAIRFCSQEGLDCYDFLAGEDRYKRSLADGATVLHWLELGPGVDAAAVSRRLSAVFRAVRRCRSV